MVTSTVVVEGTITAGALVAATGHGGFTQIPGTTAGAGFPPTEARGAKPMIHGVGGTMTVGGTVMDSLPAVTVTLNPSVTVE